MQKSWSGILRPALLGLFVFAAGPVMPAAAQTVTGTVLDVDTGAPVSGVALLLRNELDNVVARAETGEDGRFTLAARSAGDHVLEVERLGYAPVPSHPVSLDREIVEVEIRISRAPIEIEPVTVTARRHDPRHDATLDGMLARHEQLPPVGPRRVALASGPEFVGAMSVDHVLRWFGSRGCAIVYRDGMLVHSPEFVQQLIYDSSANWWQAIEFYRRYQEAPLGLRDVPSYVSTPSSCSVIALWSSDEPVAPGRSIWSRLAFATGFAAILWLMVPTLTGG